MSTARKTKAPAKPEAKAKAKAGADSTRHRVFSYTFTMIYSAWLKKTEHKGHTKRELDQIICWLTGYTPAALQKLIKGDDEFGNFLEKAPAFNPAAKLITGRICGVRVEEIADPLMRKMRQLDKLIDELAQGRAMEKILRQDG